MIQSNKYTKLDFTIREDILKLADSKAQKFGYSVDELFNYFLSEFVRAKKIPFDLDNSNPLLPIISIEELTENFEEIVTLLYSAEDAMYISHDSELSLVIMAEAKYSKLTTAVQAVTCGGYDGDQDEE